MTDSRGGVEKLRVDADTGRHDLIRGIQRRCDELKSGFHSGITGEFGKPLLIDSSLSDKKTPGADVFYRHSSFSRTNGRTQLVDLKYLVEPALLATGTSRSSFVSVTIEMSHDDQDRVTQMKLADGTRSEYQYDTQGQLVCFKLGQVTFTRDAGQRSWSSFDPNTKRRSLIEADVTISQEGILAIAKIDSTITIYPHGQTIIHFRDGSRRDRYPEGVSVYTNPQGKVIETIHPNGDRFSLLETGKESFVERQELRYEGSPVYITREKYPGKLERDGSVIVDDTSGKRKLMPDGSTQVMISRSDAGIATVQYEGGLSLILIGVRPLQIKRPHPLSPDITVQAHDIRNIKVDADYTIHFEDQSGKHSLKPLYRTLPEKKTY